MTNLEKILSVIKVDQITKDELILKYFEDQDSEEFLIGEIIYSIFKYRDFRDILWDYYNEKFDELIYNLPDTEFNIYSYREIILDDAVENAIYDAELLENLDLSWKFIQIIDGLYICKEW
jgi:hypothetical protein